VEHEAERVQWWQKSLMSSGANCDLPATEKLVLVRVGAGGDGGSLCMGPSGWALKRMCQELSHTE
jgi:hypothetical protein